MKTIISTITLLILLTGSAHAQHLLSGRITDENGLPIPSAKIFVKNDATQRTLADLDGYYEMRLLEGEYFLVFSATGYQQREAYVTIIGKPEVKDIQLFPISVQDIENVSVRAKKSNPGREIMLKVVKKRDQINPWNYPHTVDGYIKATEMIDRKSDSKKGKNEQEKKQDEEENRDPDGIHDPFAAEEKKKQEQLLNNMNLIETNFVRHYQSPSKVKEIRNGFEQRGKKRNRLYYTTTVKSNFNFFKNLLHLDDLHQTPVSSPISGPGILSYKYRLEAQYEENGRKIHKIKIIPRKTATTTLEGYIYVVDSVWLVQKLELTMEKGNLLVYDYFTIQQEFDHPGDTLCLLSKQVLDYGVKFKREASKCNTVATFSKYNFQPNFPPKFFSNEVAVTEKEAYEKDTTYWKESRTVELTEEEVRYIAYQDSIHDAHNRKEYLDSVDTEFNRITWLKVLWFGIDHRNRAKKTQWSFSSVAGTIEPIYIAGPRIDPGFDYFKKWDDERTLDGYTEVSVGILNGDIKGSTNWSYRYDPFRFGTIRAGFWHEFDVIRGYDAITQIYKRDNFIEVTDLTIGHHYEITNGLFFDTEFQFVERRSLEGYDFIEVLDSLLPNTGPDEFETYQALIGRFNLSFIPGQKYMREPHRKVILGSKWPTFYLNYEKGINGAFGSDVNHDFIYGGILHTFKIGTIGTSSYHLKSGMFLNSVRLFDADQKFHRRSDPIWFSNPLYSFQGLDSLLPTQRAYAEAHFVHHDNGAIINKIPFMKKTRIGLVFGAGALYVPEFDWQHYEIFAGLERTFKFSRRRLRLGVYGVLSDGNQIPLTPSWKVSFALMNNRNLKWNF